MTIIRRIFVLFCLVRFCLSFSQEIKKQESITVFIDFKDKSIASYIINKAVTKAQFNFYYKGYETKQARDKGLKKFRNDPENSLNEPSFTYTLYSSSCFSSNPKPPEKIYTLKGVDYITLEKFREDNLQSSSRVYILQKLKNGTYLKWETSMIDFN